MAFQKGEESKICSTSAVYVSATLKRVSPEETTKINARTFRNWVNLFLDEVASDVTDCHMIMIHFSDSLSALLEVESY